MLFCERLTFQEVEMYKVTIYTDGACLGNPGAAGIGVVLVCSGHKKEISQYIGQGTNNIAEIKAVIAALSCLKHPEKTYVQLYTDSQWVVGVLSQNWKIKKNVKLVEEAKKLAAKVAKLDVVKVKGHAGNEFNELADRLARDAIKKLQESVSCSMKTLFKGG